MPVMDIEQAVARRDVLVQAMKSLMKEGVDYGTIPGSTKPALLQPGADKLGNLFGLTLQYEFLEKEEDWKGERYGEPFFYYQVRARVYRGDFLLGEGVGSCSSWESKYRWRKAERTSAGAAQKAWYAHPSRALTGYKDVRSRCAPSSSGRSGAERRNPPNRRCMGNTRALRG
jgi:hypothetical protein